MHWALWALWALRVLQTQSFRLTSRTGPTKWHSLSPSSQSTTKHMVLYVISQWLSAIPKDFNNFNKTRFHLISSFLHPFLILSSSSSFSPFLVLQSSSPPVLVHHLVLHQAINPLKQSLCSAPCLRCSGHNVTALKIWRSTSDEIYEIYLFET